MEQKINTYEAMFLVPSGQPASEAMCEPIKTILERYGAEILRLDHWDERRLAYKIRTHKHGNFILGYFRLDPSKIVEIEHDCGLSEDIIRVQILRRDKLSAEDIEYEFGLTASMPQRMDFEDDDTPPPPTEVVDTDETEEAEEEADSEEEESAEEDTAEDTAEEPSEETGDEPEENDQDEERPEGTI